MYLIKRDEGPTKPLGTRGIAYRLLTPGAGSQHLELYVNVLESGSGPGPYHYHSNADNIYVVLAGEGEVTVDGERIAVAPGDMLSLAPGERHDIENTGAGELRVLEIKVPAGSDFITVEHERPAARSDHA
jgi:mannose-6-phosphate isomerase-like protein (cupin superfamily)